jgi:hypothetical protein
MRVTIEVTFPCSEHEWQKVIQIRAMAGANVQAQEPVLKVREDMTDNEEKILRKVNGTDSETPLLDLCAKNGYGSVNVSRTILEQVKTHPGIARHELLKLVMEATGKDHTSISNIVNTLCYAKGSQRKLDKRSIDGMSCLFPHV